jgi:hypothetical protein
VGAGVGLARQFVRPFLDRQDIAAGEDWEARLGGLIAQSDTVVFVLSPEAIKSERCRWEVDRTLALSKRLLPVIHKPVPDADIPRQCEGMGGRAQARRARGASPPATAAPPLWWPELGRDPPP